MRGRWQSKERSHPQSEEWRLVESAWSMCRDGGHSSCSWLWWCDLNRSVQWQREASISFVLLLTPFCLVGTIQYSPAIHVLFPDAAGEAGTQRSTYISSRHTLLGFRAYFKSQWIQEETHPIGGYKLWSPQGTSSVLFSQKLLLLKADESRLYSK